MNTRALLEQHLYFLSTHRGIRKSLEQVEFIESDKSAFNIAFPFSPVSIATIGSMFHIYLPGWIKADEKILSGWKKTGSITYMALPGTQSNWKINNAITVRKAKSSAEIETFSLVQGRGFCETEDDFNEWYPWMREKNLNNVSDIQQTFYVAYKDQIPAGVCLAIAHNNMTGIYAVTTLPEHRKQGISTTIMKQAISDGQQSNIHSVTLQVITDSYAHRFYKHLGFSDVFHCNIFSRE